MLNWKLTLLDLYRRGTMPYRGWANRARAKSGRAPIIVLFYHRIADDRATPWTTSHRFFERHLDWLAHRADFVSLAEAQRRIRSRCNNRLSVSITFDDGYADNCRQALPLLIDRQIPVTYFVSTHNVLNGAPFPHDLALHKQLRPNSLSELRSLAESGVEIGCHTRTHADVGHITDPVQLRDEILTAGEELQQNLGRPVRYFAFPYGQRDNLSAAAFQMAYEAGYDGVCSAYGGYNFPGDDAFHLQRIHGDDDLVRLKNWVTIDPRKLNLPRFDYEPTGSTLAVTGAAP